MMRPTSCLTGPQVALRAISCLRTLVYSVVVAKWTGLLQGFGREDVCNLKFIVVTSHCSSKIYFDMEKFYNNCHYIYQCLPVDVLQDFTFQYFLFNTLFNRVSYSIFTGSFAFYLSCHGEEFYSNADCFPCCSFFKIQHWSVL